MTPSWGLVVFDPGLVVDNLTSQGGGTYNSNSSQTNPGPGVPVPEDAASKWRPGIAGAQSRDLTITTIRGGYPGRRFSDARVVYRLASDTDAADYRGWSPPNWVTGWSSPTALWGVATQFRRRVCADPLTGTLVIVTTTSTGNATTWAFEPRSETWTAGYNFGTHQKLATGFALVAHPDTPGRVLLFSGNSGTAATPDQIAYYSDDLGATWDVYAVAYVPDGIDTSGALEVAAQPGVPWLMFDGKYTLASADAGQMWSRASGDLNSTISMTTTTGTIAARRGGGYILVYIRSGDGAVCARLLPTANHDPANMPEIEIETNAGRAAAAVSVVADHAGVLWVLAGDDADTGRVRLYGSVDEGVNWSRFQWGPSDADGTYVINLTENPPAAANGELHIVCGSSGVSAAAGELHLVRLGGWATYETGPGGINNYIDTHRMGSGRYDGASTDVEQMPKFLPIDTPENQGWTRTTGGAGGVRTFTTPGMTLACAAGADSDINSYASGGSYDTHAGEVLIQLDGSAPNLGATPGTPETQAGVTIVLADGAYTYSTRIEIGLDGIRVVDGSTGRATATIDCSVATYIRWHVTNTGKATVAYRQAATTGNTQYTTFADAVTITDGGALGIGTDLITWGNQIAGTQATTATWFMVTGAFGGAWHTGIDGPTDLDLDITDGPRGLSFGHPATTSPGFPIPDATNPANSEGVGLLVCTGGPTYVSERVTAPVLWEAGLGSINPIDSPMPSAYWEAGDVGAQTIVYDLGAPLWPGGATAIVAINARAKTIDYQVDDGAGGWATAATLDLKLPVTIVSGVGTLNTTLVGRVVTPRAGTGTIDRFIHEGELVGGWMLVSTSGGDQYREIVANSAGYWSTASGVQRVRVTLAGLDGTEDAAGTGEIYHHSGVYVHYPGSDPARQYRRFVVASMAGLLDHNGDAVVAKAGILSAGRIVAPGARANWNWTRRTEYTRSVDRAADMTPVIAKLGEPRQVWSYGWTDGLDWSRHRALEAGEAVAAAGGVPIGTDDDAWELLATVQRYMESGVIPGVVLPALPAASGMITEPTLHLYGVLVSDAVNITNVTGDDGVSEVVRMDVLSWEQLR